MANSYTEMTVGDPNAIKSKLHRMRLGRAVKLMGMPTTSPQVLDFGSGNGELANYLLRDHPDANVTLYEPASKYQQELQKNIERHGDKVSVVSNLSALQDRTFPYIFCLSVFEHLPDLQLFQAIEQLRSLCAEDAHVLVEVPNEIFAGAFLKGALRHARRPSAHDGKINNIIRATLGQPPSKRPLSDFDEGLPWHGHHLGFDHRGFEEKLQASGMFEVTGPRFAPVNALGAIAALDVYYALQPN